jgi:hypothetical protein
VCVLVTCLTYCSTVCVFGFRSSLCFSSVVLLRVLFLWPKQYRHKTLYIYIERERESDREREREDHLGCKLKFVNFIIADTQLGYMLWFITMNVFLNMIYC